MAPRNTASPTGGVDIGELFKPFTTMAPDWAKAMQGFGGQGFGAQGKVWQDMLQSHQRNIESVTKLNNAVAQAMRQIAERQVELMRVTMSEMGAISSTMPKPGAAPTMPSAEAMSAAFDRALSAMREIAEIAEKANREALATITERSQAFQAELKAMVADASGGKK
jgi:phasin family protein